MVNSTDEKEYLVTKLQKDISKKEARLKKVDAMLRNNLILTNEKGELERTLTDLKIMLERHKM